MDWLRKIFKREHTISEARQYLGAYITMDRIMVKREVQEGYPVFVATDSYTGCSLTIGARLKDF